MPWVGSSFVRTDGTRTGSTVWQEARDAGVYVNAQPADTHDQDIAEGIEETLNVNGLNSPAADISWGGQKITNLGTPTGAADAATKLYVDGHAWSLLQTQSAGSSATLDFATGITSTYDFFMFVASNLIPATDGSTIQARFSSDAGSSYASGTAAYAWTALSYAVAGTAATAGTAAATSMILTNTGIGNVANEGLSFQVQLLNPATAARKTGVTYRGLMSNTAAVMFLNDGAAYENTASAVNAVRFFFSAGNINTGTIALYGLKKS